jgi:phage/plasmid-like protein (TIGR03299 family)
MSHEITSTDSVLLRHNPAWHGLGMVIEKDLTAVEACREAKLSWEVEPWTLTATGPNGETIDVTSHVANVRVDGADLRSVLGVVTNDYRVCQNLQLAELADEVASSGKVIIESCGSIRGGKRVWFLARGESYQVGGRDLVESYMLFSNGHDGGSSLRMTPTSVRVVCSNTLHMVIPRYDGEAPASASISFNHLGSMDAKIVAAKQALSHFSTVRDQNFEMMERLAQTPISQMQADSLFAGSYAAFWETATNEELNSGDLRKRGIAERRLERMREGRAAFLERLNDEARKTGMDLTVWSAMNAMTGFVQHDKVPVAKAATAEAKYEARCERNLFGLGAQRTQEVLAASLAFGLAS